MSKLKIILLLSLLFTLSWGRAATLAVVNQTSETYILQCHSGEGGPSTYSVDTSKTISFVDQGVYVCNFSIVESGGGSAVSHGSPQFTLSFSLSSSASYLNKPEVRGRHKDLATICYEPTSKATIYIGANNSTRTITFQWKPTKKYNANESQLIANDLATRVERAFDNDHYHYNGHYDLQDNVIEVSMVTTVCDS